MKKILFCSFMLGILPLFWYAVYYDWYCDPIKQIWDAQESFLKSMENDPFLWSHYNERDVKQAQSENRANMYKCRTDLWNINLDKQYYEDAIKAYNNALKYTTKSETNMDYKIVWVYLSNAYWMLWLKAREKWDYDVALEYYNKALEYEQKLCGINYALWEIYFFKKDYNNALKFFQNAEEYYTDSCLSLKWLIKYYIDYLSRFIPELEEQNNSVTNDFFSYRTLPYLNLHNIPSAWDQVSDDSLNEVVIAIIDDWVLSSHPDLFENIRTNDWDVTANWLDEDKNGFKDDYNWWNFIYNNNNLLPLGTHGTMVAWIIWAMRDNENWIAWITKKVKLMPIWVCDGEWCKTENIIKWINYAIDNWANIINLSLWWTQLAYTKDFDDVIERAYNHWIITVISAWNWDVLMDDTYWVNTTTTPVSPLCNFGSNKKMIIWVWALKEDWNKTDWSNYWNCVQFRALWENVYTTVIPQESKDELTEIQKQMFNFWDWSTDYWAWTSFSTPIIVWIIWLWYNKFWYIHPDIVRDALKESMWTWDIVDASKYLEILDKTEDKNKEVETSFRYDLSERWYKIKLWFKVLIDSFKETTSVVSSINKYTEKQSDSISN